SCPNLLIAFISPDLPRTFLKGMHVHNGADSRTLFVTGQQGKEVPTWGWLTDGATPRIARRARRKDCQARVGSCGGPRAMATERVIFIGLQASGKSSFYRARFAQTHTVVSKDLMRNNKNRDRRQLQLIAEAFAAGRSVVVDNTNAAASDRQPLIEIARARG